MDKICVILNCKIIFKKDNEEKEILSFSNSRSNSIDPFAKTYITGIDDSIKSTYSNNNSPKS